MSMPTEYRAWLTVPNLPLEAKDAWEPLIEHLEQHHPELGPIMGWATPAHARLMMAVDADNAAAASGLMTAAPIDSLQATGLGHLHPEHVELQPAEQPEPQLTEA